MNGSKVIELHKVFKRHKFTEQETKLIIDAVDKKTDVGWLKWVMGIGFTLIFGLVITFWNDTKADIRELRTEIRDIRTDMKDIRTEIKDIRTDMKDIRTEIKELNKKIDFVIQKVK